LPLKNSPAFEFGDASFLLFCKDRKTAPPRQDKAAAGLMQKRIYGMYAWALLKAEKAGRITML
jgi:hypothetical protein